MKMVKTNCIVCGEGFEAIWRGPRRIFCGAKCRGAEKRRRYNLSHGKPGTCIICGTDFMMSAALTKRRSEGHFVTCSRPCTGTLVHINNVGADYVPSIAADAFECVEEAV